LKKIRAVVTIRVMKKTITVDGKSKPLE